MNNNYHWLVNYESGLADLTELSPYNNFISYINQTNDTYKMINEDIAKSSNTLQQDYYKSMISQYNFYVQYTYQKTSSDTKVYGSTDWNISALNTPLLIWFKININILVI